MLVAIAYLLKQLALIERKEARYLKQAVAICSSSDIHTKTVVGVAYQIS